MNDWACVQAVDPEKGQLEVGQCSSNGWSAIGHWINCFALLRINGIALGQDCQRANALSLKRAKLLVLPLDRTIEYLNDI